MDWNDPIVIVGGGLGGLTTALALARRGWPVRVLEGAPEFGAIGFGIQFGPNVFHALDRIGVSAAVLEVADTPSAVLMIDALNGKEVTRVATGAPAFHARFKYPYIIIHRIDLHNVLLDACRRDPLITLVGDAMVTRFDESGDGITVKTEDGRSFQGVLLIGADGIRSRTRAQMLADGDPLPNGFMAFRTIVPMGEVTADVQRDIVALWGGPGFHIVHYRLRRGALFNVAAVFRRSAHSERGDVVAYRAELEQAYRNAHPTMKALLAMLDLRRRQAVGDPIRSGIGTRVASFCSAMLRTQPFNRWPRAPVWRSKTDAVSRIASPRRTATMKQPSDASQAPALCAPRGLLLNPATSGMSIMRMVLLVRFTGRCLASAARPIPSNVSRGSLTAFGCRIGPLQTQRLCAGNSPFL
jgi:3-hydroxybenzoate 6-monooxygenase